MLEFACWFCGEGIESDDREAVAITVENLRRWQASSQGSDDPAQMIYAHAACAKNRMRGATMDLEPGVLGEDD